MSFPSKVDSMVHGVEKFHKALREANRWPQHQLDELLTALGVNLAEEHRLKTYYEKGFINDKRYKSLRAEEIGDLLLALSPIRPYRCGYNDVFKINTKWLKASGEQLYSEVMKYVERGDKVPAALLIEAFGLEPVPPRSDYRSRWDVQRDLG